MINLIAVVLLLFFLPDISLAEGTVDGILVVDTSGTMAKNDPEGHRIDGQKTFLDVLSSDEDNRFGIVHFDTNARLIQALTLLQKENLNYFKQKLQEPKSGGPWTEIGRGLDKAYEAFSKQHMFSSKQYVILITDGEVERSHDGRENEAARKELNLIVSKFKKSGIPIFTMALTEHSCLALKSEDQKEMKEETSWTQGEKLLQKIAEDTGGDFRRILSREDIARFVELVYTRVRSLTVNITGERGEFFTSRFDKAIISIVPPSSVLVSPSGENYSFHSNPNTLPLKFAVSLYPSWGVIIVYRPEDEKLWDNKWQGMWRVQKSDGTPIPDQEILVKSNLRLLWGQVIRNEYSQNEVVDINVKIEHKGEGSKEILENALSNVKCTYYVWKPNSKEPTAHELKDIGNYLFKGEFDETDVQGEYNLKVECVNEKINLKRNIYEKFVVTEPYFVFKGINKNKGDIFNSSVNNKAETLKTGEDIQLIIEKTEYFPKLASSLDVKAEIILPSKKKENINFKKDEEKKSYISDTYTFGRKGAHYFEIEVKGKRSVKLEQLSPWSYEPKDVIKEIPFVIRYKQEIQVTGTLWYLILFWLKWTIITLFLLAIAYSGYLHILPDINVNLEILEPEPRILTINFHDKPWWSKLLNKVFPKKERMIGSGPKADYRLPDKPVEEDTGLSAKLKVDKKGNIHIRSMTKPSHIKIGNTTVDQKGVLIRKEMEMLEDFKIQIGKYLIRFS